MCSSNYAKMVLGNERFLLNILILYLIKFQSKSRSRASTTSRKRNKQRESEDPVDGSNASLTDESRQHMNRKQCSKDMAPCRSLLAEMEKHEDAWPFLVPVNPKQVGKCP